MWRDAAAVVCVLTACGCSSTTNVTNVYEGGDASGDAVQDAPAADAAGETKADVATPFDSGSTQYECFAPSDCVSARGCCGRVVVNASSGSKSVAQTAFTDLPCATWWPSTVSSVGVPSCSKPLDCPKGYSVCCHDALGHGYCDNGCQ